MVASGNDFLVMERPRERNLSLRALAEEACQRKFGVGADGLLVLERSLKADVRMRVFNADGSEAEMCGNGARCVALFVARRPSPVARRRQIKIETKAGIIDSEVKGENVKIRLTDSKKMRLNIPLKLNNRTIRVNFINTGVPHTVIFVEGIEKIDVSGLGRQLRYHKFFAPKGTNVDFVEVVNNNTIKIRTYERGVEDETLACGTGAVAAALITDYRLPITDYHKINVHTQGGETLKVYFERIGETFRNVWLEAGARIVFKAAYNPGVRQECGI
jgi:diaminopimelate epimerase